MEVLERIILKLIYGNRGVCIESGSFRIKSNIWPLEREGGWGGIW